MGRDEIDILARDRNLHYVAVEVRGRCSFQFPPTQYLSEPKVSALKRAASKLAKQKREYVRIEFIEILGSLPDSKFKLAWLYLRIWLGIGTHLRVRWFEV